MYDPDKTGRIPANDMVKVLCLVFGDSFPTSAKGVKFLSQVKEVQYKYDSLACMNVVHLTCFFRC